MKAIIFDCDGVLVDSEVIYKTSELLFLERVGLFYDQKDFIKRFMGRSESHFFDMINADHIRKHGTPLPDGFYDELKAYEREQFATLLAPVPGMSDILVETVHLPRAVASSSSIPMLDLKLGKTGFDKIFEGRVFSADMVERGKPFPDLFLYTSEKISVAPEDCVVIEDSANGVLAALAAGMTAIGFCGGGHCLDDHGDVLKEAGAHMIAKDSEELGYLLEDLFKHEQGEQLSLA